MSIEKAWSEYQHKLFTFIYSKVETKEDAEDILNDVFTKLTKAVNENHAPKHISAWLYRVTKNSIIDYYRSRKNLESLPEDISAKSNDNSAIKQLSKCMLPMIKTLPDLYQQPLLLSEIEGEKYADIATELNLTVSAVKSRILRGRSKLHHSIISCCTIDQNNAGEITDFSPKSANSCANCED